MFNRAVAALLSVLAMSPVCVAAVEAAQVPAATSASPQTAVARDYVQARFDARLLRYQVAGEQLQWLKKLDQALLQARSAPDFTPEHPIWKAVRADLLAQSGPPLAALFSLDNRVRDYQTALPQCLSPGEINQLTGLLRTDEARWLFRAERLLVTKETIQDYLRAIKVERLPEVIEFRQALADLDQVAADIKTLPRPDAPAEARIKALNSAAAWQKLPELVRNANEAGAQRLNQAGQNGILSKLIPPLVSRALDAYRQSKAPRP